MAGGTLADARTGRNGRHAVTSRVRWRRPSITKFAQEGPSLLYCDSLGGAFADQSGNSIAVFHGFVYVTGTINGRIFPVVNSVQDSPPGRRYIFVSKISQDGNLFSYSTYLGGNQNDEGNAIAVGPGGDAYVTGRTGRTDIGAEHDRECRGQIDKPSGSKARDHETRCGTTLQDSGDAHSCEQGQRPNRLLNIPCDAGRRLEIGRIMARVAGLVSD
jgi:hypothetical protein